MPPPIPSTQALQRLFDNADEQDLATIGLLINAASDTGRRLAKLEAVSTQLRGTAYQGVSTMLDSILYDA